MDDCKLPDILIESDEVGHDVISCVHTFETLSAAPAFYLEKETFKTQKEKLCLPANTLSQVLYLIIFLIKCKMFRHNQTCTNLPSSGGSPREVLE